MLLYGETVFWIRFFKILFKLGKHQSVSLFKGAVGLSIDLEALVGQVDKRIIVAEVILAARCA